MPERQEDRLPARCTVGDCQNLSVAYKRIVTPTATVRLRVCRRHAALFA